jgi:hypothetical protein
MSSPKDPPDIGNLKADVPPVLAAVYAKPKLRNASQPVIS